MRSLAFATVVLVMLAPSAFAQTAAPAPPAVSGVKPKPVATVPVRPALQTPADTASAMAQAERLAIQSDLAWTGVYNGAITGEVSERMVAAIKAFQKDHGGKPTGVLNPQERTTLADAARKLQANVGWKIVTDPASGARIGIPSKLVPQQASDANGARWASTTGTIQIQLSRRKEAGPTTQKLADAERREPAGRRIDYAAVKPDFFVLSGMQGLKKFYVRGSFRDSEVRILTILYDQATEGTMAPVVIAMSSAFNPFPAGAQATAPRRSVDYSTGLVVSADGAVIADRNATEGCQSIVIAGYGNAERIAEGKANEKAGDKTNDLALLRLYGARGLTPLTLGGSAAQAQGSVQGSIELVGIADPQSQGGGSAVSALKAQLASGGDEPSITPAPGLGFSGAPALDANGGFAGVALLKPVVVAAAPGAAPAPPATQASLVRADAVRDLLKRHGVDAAGGQADAKAAVVRVICVRR